MQKNITLLLLLVLGVFSCGSSSTENASAEVSTPKEIIERELLTLIDIHNKGVKPNVSIDDIKEHDTKVEPYIIDASNGKSDLGYKSKVIEGIVTIEKIYKRKHIEKELLKSMEVIISLEEEYDEETDKLLTESIDLEIYKIFLDKNLPEGGTYELFNDDHTWAYGGYRAVLSQFSKTTLVFSFRKW